MKLTIRGERLEPVEPEIEFWLERSGSGCLRLMGQRKGVTGAYVVASVYGNLGQVVAYSYGAEQLGLTAKAD